MSDLKQLRRLPDHGSSQLYLLSSRTRKLMPVISDATDTKSKATQTSGVGLESCCDMVFCLNYTILGLVDDDADG